MKRVLLAASAAILVGALSTPALAQSIDDDDAGASVTVVQPINVTKTQDLQLGAIIVNAAGGTYELMGDGTPNDDPGNTDLLPSGPAPATATFTIDADPSVTYDVTVQDGITLNRAGGGSVTLSTDEAGLIDGLPNGGVAESGDLTVNVGGRIAFPAATLAGTYTGQLNLQAEYN